MRTLLIEPTPAGQASLAADLHAAGHDVVRCHPSGGPAFPCAGLTLEGCPLDHGPVDVTVAVRDEATSQPDADEAGVTCAARAGIPIVVVGPDGPNPFAPWAVPCHDPADLADACDQAIDSVARRRAEPLGDEARRVIAREDVDAGAVHVTVRREGDTAHVRVLTDRSLPTSLAGTIATRLHAVDQRGSWPTTKFAVSFGTVG
ncbi:hypothetical protein ACE2AJ_10055 [Aquihabitans daechungensis]|uniref:hypothetical protein n=1 Tax=Aquihabitans daechungensis TaxID=1052257 RepID=UPI003BA201FA